MIFITDISSHLNKIEDLLSYAKRGIEVLSDCFLENALILSTTKLGLLLKTKYYSPEIGSLKTLQGSVPLTQHVDRCC